MIRQYSNKEILQIIGENARRYRRELNLSQLELAASTGLSTSTIQLFESGKINISLSNLLTIMRSLGQIENITALFPEQPENPYKTFRRY